MRRLFLLVGLVFALMALMGCQNQEAAETVPLEKTTIDEAVHGAIIDQGVDYLAGEVATEGHVILETEAVDKLVKVYTVASFGYFAFENGIFTKVSGSGAIPTVLTFDVSEPGTYLLTDYQEPEDGSNYSTSIQELFPEHLWDKVLQDNDYYQALKEQQESQAKAYLASIGRQATVQEGYVERDLATIDVEASNKLFFEYAKEDAFLNNCPTWLGSREVIENNQRFEYVTSQGKDSAGNDLVVFQKINKDNGQVVTKRQYRIVGSDVQEIK